MFQTFQSLCTPELILEFLVILVRPFVFITFALNQEPSVQ